jgi:hypothetical protein
MARALAIAELIIDFAPLSDSKELRSIFAKGIVRPTINAAIPTTTVISTSVTPFLFAAEFFGHRAHRGHREMDLTTV